MQSPVIQTELMEVSFVATAFMSIDQHITTSSPMPTSKRKRKAILLSSTRLYALRMEEDMSMINDKKFSRIEVIPNEIQSTVRAIRPSAQTGEILVTMDTAFKRSFKSPGPSEF